MNTFYHNYILPFIFRRLTIVTGIIIILQHTLYARILPEKTIKSDERNYSEELHVQTDRDIYIAGEEVFLKIFKFSRYSHAPGNVSRVIYVDLHDVYNNPVIQLKIGIDGFSGPGEFRLPDTLRTGNYLIRCFTNWMQNFSPELFSYKVISVINPFENINRMPSPASYRQTDTLTSYPETGYLDPESVSDNSIYGTDIKIKLNSADYPIREKVKINISATDPEGNPVETDLLVSVARSFASGRDNSGNSTGYIQRPLQEATNPNNLPSRMESADTIPEYLPELDGHLISGTIRSKITGEPLREESITLSFIGKNAGCRFTRTDEEGCFNFITREHGLEEIVIQPLSAELRDYYIELRDPFPGIDKRYIPPALYIDTGNLEAINKAIIGMQVKNIYHPFLQARILKSDSGDRPDFFGDPDLSVELSEYIELTSLKEVIREIVPGVSIYTKNDKTNFKLINKYPGQIFENDPLVLFDGVPVYDADKILSVKSSEIEKIEILNTRYFISDIIIDGIINIVSRKGDLSVLESDRSVFRQEFHGLQTVYESYSPDYSTDSLKNSRIPDFRNTLYWNPDVRTDKNGLTSVEFYTSDEGGEYKVIVEGFTSDGKAGRSVTRLIVKNNHK